MRHSQSFANRHYKSSPIFGHERGKIDFLLNRVFFFFNFFFLLRSLKCKERESVENIDYKLQGEHFNCCLLSVLKLGVMYLTKLCQEVVR